MLTSLQGRLDVSVEGASSPRVLWIPQEGNSLEFKQAGPKQGALTVCDLAQGDTPGNLHVDHDFDPGVVCR